MRLRCPMILSSSHVPTSPQTMAEFKPRSFVAPSVSRVVFGAGTFDTAVVEEVGQLCAAGGNVVVVCPPGRGESLGDTAVSLLHAAGFDASKVAMTKQHVPADLVEEAVAASTCGRVGLWSGVPGPRGSRVLLAASSNVAVAIGGGSTIGLVMAAALPLPSMRYSAVPTTYAGSEMANIYGIKRGEGKVTGMIT